MQMQMYEKKIGPNIRSDTEFSSVCLIASEFHGAVLFRLIFVAVSLGQKLG